MTHIDNKDLAEAIEPVAAQHRFRHLQDHPEWSVWHYAEIDTSQPERKINGMGYEVEYRNLYAAKVSEIYVGTIGHVDNTVAHVVHKYNGKWPFPACSVLDFQDLWIARHEFEAEAERIGYTQQPEENPE